MLTRPTSSPDATQDESSAAEISASDRVDARGMRAWRNLLRAHAAVTRVLEAELEETHGLPLASYDVLVQLAESPGGALRMSELADAVLLSRSGLTRLVDRLEAAGYVTRCAAEDDGRGAYAELTASGLEMVTTARRTHLDGVRRHFLSHLSDEEQAALGDVWARLQADSAAL
jgi:DNA-binding MarR family transcriptional regulator